MEKRENCYILLELLPPVTIDSDDSEVIESHLLEKQSDWKTRVDRGQQKYKNYIDFVPEICSIMMGRKDLREREARTAVFEYASGKGKLDEIRTKVLPRTFDEIKNSLSAFEYTDIYDFLNRTPEKNTIKEKPYTIDAHKDELIARATQLNDNYRNLATETATKKMHLTSRIIAFLKQDHKDMHDRILMLDAKIDICKTVDTLHKNGEINEDSIANIASKRARSFLHYDDIHNFIYDYCGYMRYEPEELPVLMSTDSSSSEIEDTILSEVDTLLSEEIAILSEVDTILSETGDNKNNNVNEPPQKHTVEKEQISESSSKPSKQNKSNKSNRTNLPVREKGDKRDKEDKEEKEVTKREITKKESVVREKEKAKAIEKERGKEKEKEKEKEQDDYADDDDYENDEPTSRALLISIVALLIIGAIITGIVIAILQI